MYKYCYSNIAAIYAKGWKGLSGFLPTVNKLKFASNRLVAGKEFQKNAELLLVINISIPER